MSVFGSDISGFSVNARDRRFRGITAPFIDEGLGPFAAKDTGHVIWSSIINILMTPIGTRVWLLEFGCFAGSTKIPLLDGYDVPIGDLQGKVTDLYGCKPNGLIVPTSSPGAVFKGNKRTVNVRIDNGEEITCTPEHLFMLRDGTYREAVNLRPGDSLMPLYRKDDVRGYETVFNPASDKYEPTHKLMILGDKPDHIKHAVRHHIDFNKRNNCPSNLEWMEASEHIGLHADQVATMFEPGNPLHEYWHGISPEVVARRKSHVKLMEDTIAAHNKRYQTDDEYRMLCRLKRAQTEKRNGTNKKQAERTRKLWKDPAYRQTMSDNMSDTMRAFYASPENRKMLSQRSKEQGHLEAWRAENPEKVSANGKYVGKRYGAANCRKWAQSEKGRENCRQLGLARRKHIADSDLLDYSKKLLGENLSREEVYCKVEDHFGISRSTLKRRVPLSLLNHKVVEVTHNKRRSAVYDLVNSRTDNYALSAGVFVHNSRLTELIFEPNDQQLEALARDAVFGAIQRWEPRVRLLDMKIYRNEFDIHLTMTYEIIRDNKLETRTLNFDARSAGAAA